jgi:hypothetical protein
VLGPAPVAADGQHAAAVGVPAGATSTPFVQRGDLERRAGPRRGVLEDQRDVPASEPVLAEAQLLVRPHLVAEIDQAQEFLAGEVDLFEQAASVQAMSPLIGSWPNSTASSIAPTAIAASTNRELMPAPARTAGMVNTPVPMMLPMTRAVAEVRPSARAFC